MLALANSETAGVRGKPPPPQGYAERGNRPNTAPVGASPRSAAAICGSWRGGDKAGRRAHRARPRQRCEDAAAVAQNIQAMFPEIRFMSGQ